MEVLIFVEGGRGLTQQGLGLVEQVQVERQLPPLKPGIGGREGPVQAGVEVLDAGGIEPHAERVAILPAVECDP